MFKEIETRFVLINTSHPGNIGSAARAMKTMGFSDLVLVEPKRFPAAEAGVMAAGADDILANAKCVKTLDEAINDCTLVLGTSARDRSLPWPLIDPSQAADIVLQEKGKVAILFGREDKGLKNEELQRCHYHVQIPANPVYSSLNIASAVQVLTYQLRMHFEKLDSRFRGNDASGHSREGGNPELRSDVLDSGKQFRHSRAGGNPENAGYDSEIADSKTMELFFQHLDETLHQLDFLNPKNPNRIMPRLRRVFHRAKPDTTEINILRGILSKIQWHLQK